MILNIWATPRMINECILASILKRFFLNKSCLGRLTAFWAMSWIPKCKFDPLSISNINRSMSVAISDPILACNLLILWFYSIMVTEHSCQLNFDSIVSSNIVFSAWDLRKLLCRQMGRKQVFWTWSPPGLDWTSSFRNWMSCIKIPSSRLQKMDLLSIAQHSEQAPTKNLKVTSFCTHNPF